MREGSKLYISEGTGYSFESLRQETRCIPLLPSPPSLPLLFISLFFQLLFLPSSLPHLSYINNQVPTNQLANLSASSATSGPPALFVTSKPASSNSSEKQKEKEKEKERGTEPKEGQNELKDARKEDSEKRDKDEEVKRSRFFKESHKESEEMADFLEAIERTKYPYMQSEQYITI